MKIVITLSRAILIAPVFIGAGAYAADSYATQANIKQCELTMEVAMMVGDMPDAAHLQAAKNHLAELDAVLAKAKQQHSELSGAIDTYLTDEKTSLVKEMFVTGYDTSSHLAFVIAQRNVTAELGRFSKTEHASKSTTMAFEVCDLVANYLLVTTSPLGPDNVANFNNEETDFPARLAKVDADFDALAAHGDVDIDVLRKTRMQWNFIRTPLMQFNKLSAPFLVHRTGKTVISNLLGM